MVPDFERNMGLISPLYSMLVGVIRQRIHRSCLIIFGAIDKMEDIYSSYASVGLESHYPRIWLPMVQHTTWAVYHLQICMMHMLLPQSSVSRL